MITWSKVALSPGQLFRIMIAWSKVILSRATIRDHDSPVKSGSLQGNNSGKGKRLKTLLFEENRHKTDTHIM
jgi:hypothetical protein